MYQIDDIVSIIIPCWNLEKYISRCIESILKQTYTYLEIILINDGSSDSTLSICEEYKKLDSRIKVISQKNSGVSIARNTGLKAAKGSYIMFIDGDDYVDSIYVERMLEIANRHQAKIVVCHGLDCNVDGTLLNGQKKYLGKSGETKIKFNDEYNFHGYYSHMTVWGVLFEREIIKNQIFNDKLYVGEDTLFYVEALKKSNEFYYIDEGMYHYIHYPVSAARGKYDLKKLTEVDAWEEVIKILDVNTFVWKSGRGQLASRSIKLLKLMYVESSNIDKELEKKLIRIIRRDVGYYIRLCKSLKSKLAHILFAISPRVYWGLKQKF